MRKVVESQRRGAELGAEHAAVLVSGVDLAAVAIEEPLTAALQRAFEVRTSGLGSESALRTVFPGLFQDFYGCSWEASRKVIKRCGVAALKRTCACYVDFIG